MKWKIPLPASIHVYTYVVVVFSPIHTTTKPPRPTSVYTHLVSYISAHTGKDFQPGGDTGPYKFIRVRANLFAALVHHITLGLRILQTPKQCPCC